MERLPVRCGGNGRSGRRTPDAAIRVAGVAGTGAAAGVQHGRTPGAGVLRAAGSPRIDVELE